MKYRAFQALYDKAEATPQSWFFRSLSLWMIK